MKGEFISNIFLREKKEKGKYRLILNLKHLNKFTEKLHFKMDTLLTTLALVTPGCTFMSFDFSDAYYSCSIFPPHRKFLRFSFEGKLCEFTCLPNGLSSAPRFFTKISKVALTQLRKEQGITISGYLDDNILVNYQSAEKATENGSFTAELFQDLGFTINIAKSVMFPTTKIEHLGFIVDSNLMLVSMTEHKTGKIIELIKDVLKHNRVKIRTLASRIRKINATKPANRWAFMFTRKLEMEKNNALALQRYN